jgi:hypothetical protein
VAFAVVASARVIPNDWVGQQTVAGQVGTALAVDDVVLLLARGSGAKVDEHESIVLVWVRVPVQNTSASVHTEELELSSHQITTAVPSALLPPANET